MVARIAVMAGGTGGHVFPALAVAHELRARGADLFWMGTRTGLESRLVPAAGFDIEWLSVQGLRGKGLNVLLSGPWRLALALREAAALLRRRAPDVVLGMGGFVSGPGGVMAWRQQRPLVIQEQNSIPGLTNQWLARVATRVFEGFPNSFPAPRQAVLSGNPVRAEIARLAPPAVRFLDRSGPTRLLVLGGSLGARTLNQVVPQALAQLPEAMRPKVLHQAGERTLDVARNAYRQAGVEASVQAFIADMATAYQWADMMVCRAGALTVAEIAAAGLPAILVPYPYAVDDHQVTNAKYLVDAGAAHLVLEGELNPVVLSCLLDKLCADAALRLTMAQAARTMAQPDAASRIADACLELCTR